MAGGAPALALHGITKHWGKLCVLNDATLEVQPGEQAWVGGHNGAGKTTLLRIAAGLILPESGEVRIHGLDPERERRRFQMQLGFLSAGNSGLYARLTVRDNLEFWAGIAFVPRPVRAAAIDSVLERFGLTELGGRRVDRLSMGQRQRIRLAGVFLHGPKVVLLDEPETSLDDAGLDSLRDALDEHAAAGGSAVICSPSRHKLEFEVQAAYVIQDAELRRA